MILVEAPEGHDVGESKVSAASFDDMDLDALLENRAAQPKRPLQVPANAPAKRTPPNAAQRSATPQKEIQPGENWTNPATKQKQKVILAAMASLGGLLILAAVGFFLFSKNNDRVVADATDVAQQRDSVAPADDATPDPKDADATTETPEATATAPAPLEEEPDPIESQSMDAPPIPGIPDAAPAIPGIGSDDPTTPMPEGFGGDASEANDPNDIESSSSSADPEDAAARLRAFLSKSGTSLPELQNAASVAENNFLIGTPKYFFEKVGGERIDATRQKDQKLIGVKFEKQKLQAVLHELSSISGLSLTIHAPSIAAAGGDVNPDVEIQIENESTANVIRKIAESVGLRAIETDTGFNIVPMQNDEFVRESIGIALLVENEADKKLLVELVQNVVWPGTWKQDAKPDDVPVANSPARGDCEIEGTNLVINHAPAVIAEVTKLMKSLREAMKGDKKESELLQPIPWVDQGKFAKPFEPRNSARTSVGKFLRTLSDDYDVKLFGDWHSLAQVGWSSDSMAPSLIEEQSVGDVVRETAHGLGAGLYFVDEDTVWLTAPNNVDNIFLLRVYPLAGVSKGALSPQQIGLILSDSLGNQASEPGVSFFFLPKQQLMVLRAPQAMHRQVNAVFEELK